MRLPFMKLKIPKPIRTTPPRVYEKIYNQLLLNPRIPDGATSDHKEAIENARMALLKKKKIVPENPINSDYSAHHEHSDENSEAVEKKSNFIERLINDGGEKIIRMYKNYIHIDHTRFIEPCGDIKGLSLNDALLQLEWNKKQISMKKMKEALTDAILKAKDSNFDISKTYIAEAYVKNSSHGLSQRFTSKYLRGRGRYGATANPKTARLELILQQRESGFSSREKDDPLEWLRVRLRNQKAHCTKTASEIAKSISVPRKIIFH